METLNFPLQTKPQGTTTFNVRSASFGDGYVQRVGNGAINNKTQVWNCTFDGDMAETEVVKAFLDRHGGYMRFLWTPPNAPAPLMWICMGYTEAPDVASQNILTFTLTQAF